MNGKRSRAKWVRKSCAESVWVTHSSPAGRCWVIQSKKAVRLAESSMDCGIEVRVILLDVLGPIFFAKFLNHGFHGFRLRRRLCLQFRPCTARVDANLRILKYVLVPLRLGSAHRKQEQFVAFEDKPDRMRDYSPRIPADYAQFDLPVAGEAVFQIVGWHSVILRSLTVA